MRHPLERDDLLFCLRQSRRSVPPSHHDGRRWVRSIDSGTRNRSWGWRHHPFCSESNHHPAKGLFARATIRSEWFGDHCCSTAATLMHCLGGDEASFVVFCFLAGGVMFSGLDMTLTKCLETNSKTGVIYDRTGCGCGLLLLVVVWCDVLVTWHFHAPTHDFAAIARAARTTTACFCFASFLLEWSTNKQNINVRPGFL